MNLIENSKQILFDGDQQDMPACYDIRFEGKCFQVKQTEFKSLSNIGDDYPNLSPITVTQTIGGKVEDSDVTWLVNGGSLSPNDPKLRFENGRYFKKAFRPSFGSLHLDYVAVPSECIILILTIGEKQPTRFVCKLEGIIKI